MPSGNKSSGNKPKDNKQPEKKRKKKKRGFLSSIRESIAKSSPGGFLISKSRERVDSVLKNLK